GKRMDHLLQCMKIIGDDTIQRTQLKHRLELVKAFDVKEGMRILEIGCGQGDTTVVLAEQVGEAGHIMAIDIANPDYGAPITLGEATDTIKASPLGERITFAFETDLLDIVVDEPFDVVVLSHCSWYFRDPEQLQRYFSYCTKLAKRICVAEWDVHFRERSQLPHFYAISILALYSQFVENDGNIQHVFSKGQLIQMMETSGWTLKESKTIDATYLQDGGWEVDYARSVEQDFTSAPPRIQTLIRTYYELLRSCPQPVQSLNSVVLTSELFS
ncbi:MAG: SAM-dependent methyltransferase, partial [Lysinibacillus sp.]